MATFKPNDAAKIRIPTLSEAFAIFCISQAEEFMDLGHSNSEACSIVANMMVREAWVIAATGVISDGKKPNPDNFRAAVNDMIDSVKFSADIEETK